MNKQILNFKCPNCGNDFYTDDACIWDGVNGIRLEDISCHKCHRIYEVEFEPVSISQTGVTSNFFSKELDYIDESLIGKEIELITNDDNKFILDDKGRVIEYSNGLNVRNESEENKNKWVITGAYSTSKVKDRYDEEYDTISSKISLIDFINMAVNKPNKLINENREPIYALTDVDHGTQRYQGIINYAGIINVKIIDR